MKTLFTRRKLRFIKYFCLIATSVYLFIIFSFALLYFNFGSIESKSAQGDEEILAPSFGDNIYFSFVTFHTIGFGDFKPENTSGKILICIEAIFSMVFQAGFSGILIWIFIKRFSDVIISDFVLLGPNKNGNLSVSVRFGNLGSHIADVTASLAVYEFGNGGKIRTNVFEKSRDYHTMLDQTAFLFRVELTVPNGTTDSSEPKTLPASSESEKRTKLRSKLLLATSNLSKSKRNDYQAAIQLIFSFKGVDQYTGDFVGVSKVYTEKDFKFGGLFNTVVIWKDLDPQNRGTPLWNNFNSIKNELPITEFLSSFNY